LRCTILNNNELNECRPLKVIDRKIDFIALPIKAGIKMRTQITIRTSVIFVLLSDLIMSSFQDFNVLVYYLVTIISSLRDSLGREFLTTMNRGSE